MESAMRLALPILQPLFQPAGLGLASVLLGKQFISPGDIASKIPALAYHPEHVADLEQTLPSKAELEDMRTTHFLIAGPPTEMSLLALHDLFRDQFLSGSSSWYQLPEETFSQTDLVTPGWLKPRRQFALATAEKFWPEQLALIPEPEYVMNIAETVWALTMLRIIRGEHPEFKLWVRTASLDERETHVSVSRVADKFTFSVHPDANPHNFLWNVVLWPALK
jgi:hypothetical protein